MRALWPCAGAVALTIAGASCDHEPSEGACEELLAHVVAIEARAASGAAADAATDLERTQRDVRDYLGEDFVDTCRDRYSRERVACALGAASYEEVLDCGDT